MISVIVPAYNVEKTIAQTIESILSQTYKEIEIIVVDDGSSDGTGRIADNFGKLYSRIKAIHIPNSGVTEARMVGVAAASGEWIGFVDGDDIIDRDMYEILLNNAIKYGASISHCGYQMVFPDDRIHYFHNSGCLVLQDQEKGLRDLLEGVIVEPGLCNKIFHKSLFKELLKKGFPDTSIRINEDLLMNFCLFMQSKGSVFYDVCKYRYIVRNESASRSKINKHRIYDPIKVRKLILELAPENIKDDAKRAYISSCITCYNSIVLEYDKKLKNDKLTIRNLIIEKKEWISLLGKKQKILAYLILYFNWFYGFIYKVYAKYFLYNPYK